MEPTELLNEILGCLLVNSKNLKRNLTRSYLLTTLERKKRYCEQKFREGIALLADLEDDLKETTFHNYKARLNIAFEEVNNLLLTKINQMSAKLDLSLALKLVKPFDGSVTQLTSYMESVELLSEYSEGVPEASILKFLKTTLTGAAHGSIDGATTVRGAFEALRTKFAIKITPKAVENEMSSKKQLQKTISEFGAEIDGLAAKLAAAHVSAGTFASEAAAANIVDPIAVQAFVDGLKDPSTKFFLKARNPPNLNKAISDALECAPTTYQKPDETTLWCSFQHHNHRGYSSYRGKQNSRGQGFHRGRGPPRGSYRGRGSYQNYNTHYNSGYHNNYSQNAGYRGNGRGRGQPQAVNVAEAQPPRQPQPQQQHQQQQNNRQEEANLIDLFR